MNVPNFQVFCFRIFKRPFFSSLWYAALCYTIWDPNESLPTVLGILFLILSFTPIKLYLGTLSIIPCIVTVILSGSVFVNPVLTIIYVAAAIWVIIWIFAIFVWHRLDKGIYVVSPVTGTLHYDMQYYISKGLRK